MMIIKISRSLDQSFNCLVGMWMYLYSTIHDYAVLWAQWLGGGGGGVRNGMQHSDVQYNVSSSALLFLYNGYNTIRYIKNKLSLSIIIWSSDVL